MNFREFLKENIVYLDGAMGTLLQKEGLLNGGKPEALNITHRETIIKIHKAYFDNGSNVVSANTFGANTLKFSEAVLDEVVKAAFENANEAREKSENKGEKFVALDIGPLGKLLKPLGDLEFEEAVEIFAKTVKLGVKYGADLVLIETMNDSLETKAALLAVKENSDLPVLVCNAYSQDKKLMTGSSPEIMTAMLEAMGADAIGANCSLGPKQLFPIVKEIISCASVPVILKANAGLPREENGKTVFDVDSEEFSEDILKAVNEGVSVIGGCCGTNPEYIQKIYLKTKGLKPKKIEKKNKTVVCSSLKVVEFGKVPILIGERINPTGKKRFKQALLENDINYILNEGISQEEKGVDILDVNVGLPQIDEEKMLAEATMALSSVTSLPLQIDTSNISAMEKALRGYNGKAMINSVNGKAESMEAVFPLVKKYGGVVVALTLDENGIPNTPEGRFKIAEKILKTAQSYGIDKKDIVFDTLAMTISADTSSAQTTVCALKRIKEELGCHTSLGVSNISFGLPNRDAINSAFFALCLENSLSAAIMNPYSSDMMKTYYAFKALKGMDKNCADYIKNADSFITAPIEKAIEKTSESYSSELEMAISKGLLLKAAEITESLLLEKEPLEIVNNEIIPALNHVGKGFENKTVYLPQLLMSAEAAKSAFEVIKLKMPSKSGTIGEKIVIATVYGDIHDIGKNIVKLLLENFGFNVIDLGKDVAPESVLEAVLENDARLLGLSALMTTTVPSMEKTIKLVNEKAKNCKIVVGGAVLTEDYAKKIGADKYCKDAMQTVRYAESIFRAK